MMRRLQAPASFADDPSSDTIGEGGSSECREALLSDSYFARLLPLTSVCGGHCDPSLLSPLLQCDCTGGIGDICREKKSLAPGWLGFPMPRRWTLRRC